MSANKYGSIVRTYTVRNLYEATLTVGNDITLPQVDNRTLTQLVADISRETIFSPRRIGIFSNFADGLVFKNPADRINIGVQYDPFVEGDRYTLGFTQGAKAVTTVAGTPGWTPGTTYPLTVYVPVTVTGFGNEQVVVNITATGANTGDLEDYWQYGTNNLTARALSNSVIVPTTRTVLGISALNCMYEFNDVATPFLIEGGGNFDVVRMRLNVNRLGGGSATNTTTFMTHAIDSSFNDSDVYFDAVVEVEFTGVIS